MLPDDPRHGQRRGYYAHRAAGEEACKPCKRAAAAMEQSYVLARIQGRPLRVPALGTKRRMRALQALGWTLTEIAAQMGSERSRVEKWCSEEKHYVYASTAQRVAEVYDRLSMIVPEGPWATRTRNHARKQGYAPPLAYDDIDNDPEPTGWEYRERITDNQFSDALDPVVVMRLLEGDRVPSTKAEKEAAMAQWIADGGARNELARWHGWKPERYTARLRLVDGEAS